MMHFPEMRSLQDSRRSAFLNKQGTGKFFHFPRQMLKNTLKEEEKALFFLKKNIFRLIFL